MVIVVRPRRSLVERRLDRALGLVVQRAGRLVEHQHPRVAQQRAGDRQPLLLAAGEPVAAGADHGVVARRAARRPGRGSAPRGRPPRSRRRWRRGFACSRFSRTVAVQQVGLLASPRRRSRPGPPGRRSRTSTPSMVTPPAVGSCSRATSEASVVLPLPVSPTRARLPPAGTVRSMPCSTARSPLGVREGDVLEARPRPRTRPSAHRRGGVVDLDREVLVLEDPAEERQRRGDDGPTSSSPISGRNSAPCRAVKATRVPMVMPPEVAGSPAAR